jgi:WD40 repeat protein
LRRRYSQATWIKTGPGANPVALLTELARRLGIAEPSYETVEQAQDALASVLAGRRLLIVLDNVWTRAPLDAVLGLAPHCPVLFTTRDKDLATAVAAVQVPVDEMTQAQALEVLANWTGQSVDRLPQVAWRLCARLRNLALGVAMAGAMAARGRSFEDILALIEKDLRRVKGRFDPKYEHPTLRAAIDVSIDALPDDHRDRYLLLAVFAGRGPFSRRAVAVLWGRLADLEVEELLEDLVGRSLLSAVAGGWYIAHDLQYDTVTQRLGPTGVREAHTALLDGYQARNPGAWVPVATGDRYLVGNLAWHLHMAGRDDELEEPLSQIAWMHARITTASLSDLIDDYTHATRPLSQTIRRALLQSAYAITNQPDSDRVAGQLAGQLAGRLLAHPDASIATWATGLTPHMEVPWFRPLTHDTLSPVTGSLESTLAGHKDTVDAVAFSPDGTRIITGSRDRTARIWDATSGQHLITLNSHSHAVVAVAFSPDGTRVLTGSADRTARIWDVHTGSELTTITGHNSSITAAAFSPDGTRILTSSWDRTARIWDAQTGRHLITLTGHNLPFLPALSFASVAFSPDGTRALTSWGKATRIWDAHTGQRLLSFTDRKSIAAAFSPDGATVLTSSWDRTARIWDAHTGRHLTTFTNHTGAAHAVAFSPDGTRVLTSDDRIARICDVHTGRELSTFTGHTDHVMAVAFSPDGTRILTSSLDRTARIWNVNSDQSATIADDSARAGACSPDGTRIILIGGENHTAGTWDANSGQHLTTLTGLTIDISRIDSVNAAAFNSDGSRIITGGWDRTAHVWDAQGDRQPIALTGHRKGVSAVAFSPDGTRALTGSDDGRTRIWDARTGHKLATLSVKFAFLTRYRRWVSAATFSPDDTRVLTGNWGGKARIWDARTGRKLATLSIKSKFLTNIRTVIRSVDFSPDGMRALTANGDQAHIWDTRSGRKLATLTGHTGNVNTATFSPDGTLILTGGEDGTARIWNADTGSELCRWYSEREVRDCAFFQGKSDEVVITAPVVAILQLSISSRRERAASISL